MVWVNGRGRPKNMPHDATPLRGRTVDVVARIAWLLRMNRMASLDGGTNEEFARRLNALGFKADKAAVTRLESGARPFTPALINAYETLLDLPQGTLLGVCDSMCRTLTGRSLSVAGVVPRHERRRELARISDTIRFGEPTGGDWLAFAQLLTQPGGIVLPSFVEEEWTYRLIDEMTRGAGPSWLSRFEALSRLVTDDYRATRLVQVSLERINEPGAQAQADVLGFWGDARDAASAEAAIDLLTHDHPRVRLGAAYALLTRVVDGRLHTGQVRRLVRAIRVLAADGDPGTGEHAYMLARRIDPRLSAEVARVTRREIRPPGATGTIERPAELKRYLSAAQEISGIDEDPMLERLLREALSDDFAERRFHSIFLIAASPYAPAIAATALAIQRGESSADARAAALHLLEYLGEQAPVGELIDLQASPDPQARTAALIALAHGPGIPDDLDLQTHLLDPATALKAAYAAGMSGHPDLHAERVLRLALPEVRQAAHWWTAHGGRVIDLESEHQSRGGAVG